MPPSFVVLAKQTVCNFTRLISLWVEQAVLKEVTESEGQIVMFIDEIHTVVGAGATSGSMDASNLLKPMLARGELRCIGATTLNEYKQVWLSVTVMCEKKASFLLRLGPDPETRVGVYPIGVREAVKAILVLFSHARLFKVLSYMALMLAGPVCFLVACILRTAHGERQGS